MSVTQGVRQLSRIIFGSGIPLSDVVRDGIPHFLESAGYHPAPRTTSLILIHHLIDFRRLRRDIWITGSRADPGVSQRHGRVQSGQCIEKRSMGVPGDRGSHVLFAGSEFCRASRWVDPRLDIGSDRLQKRNQSG